MAKKSKIARNEQRKVIVERYAAKRLELKKALVDPNGTDERAKQPASACRSSPATPRRSACAAVTPSTDAPAVSSRSSVSHVFASANGAPGELPGITKSSW